MEQQFQIVTPGTSVQTQDFNLLGTVSAHADDYVLADLLRVRPDGLGETGTGTITKAIIPYTSGSDAYQDPVNGIMDIGPEYGGTVTASGKSDGSIHIRPFRAIVGSRTPISANVELQNWRDIRSVVFTATGTSTLHKTIQLAANATGNARWDLVYAAVTPDVAGTTTVRNIKNTSTNAITASTVVQTLVTGIAIAVVTGTAATPPTLPALPADGSGIYYIPLAYIRVAPGFSGSSVIPRSAICHAAPCKSMSHATGVSTCRPATSISDITSQSLSRWATTWGVNGTRPAWMMPMETIGKKTILLQLDFSNASPAAWSHQTGDIIDSSINWSAHYFRVSAYISSASSTSFASDVTNNTAATYHVPSSFGTTTSDSNGIIYNGFGQTFVRTDQDSSGVGVTNVSFASYFDFTTTGFTNVGTKTALLPAGAIVGIYVGGTTAGTTATGAFPLKLYVRGAPASRMFVILEAFGPFPSYGV